MHLMSRSLGFKDLNTEVFSARSSGVATEVVDLLKMYLPIKRMQKIGDLNCHVSLPEGVEVGGSYCQISGGRRRDNFDSFLCHCRYREPVVPMSEFPKKVGRLCEVHPSGK